MEAAASRGEMLSECRVVRERAQMGGAPKGAGSSACFRAIADQGERWETNDGDGE